MKDKNMNNLLSKICVSALTISSFLFTGCSSDEGAGAEDNPMVPIELSADEAEVSEDLSGFAFRLLDEAVARSDGRKNVAVSPLGAAMVTAMVGNALDPAERGEVLTALGVKSMEGLNSYCSRMLETLPSHDKTSRLVLANGAWFAAGRTSLSESYRSILADAFKAEVRTADFSSPALLPEINGWVKDKTGGLIPRILDGLNEEELAIWLNTIYFNGLWKECDKKVEAKPADFLREDGTTAKIDMLSGIKMASWGRTENKARFSTVEYGNGGFALTLVMPDEGVSMKDFIPTLTGGFMNQVKNMVDNHSAAVWFPKMDISMQIDLREPMKALGMRSAFESAEMPGIGVNDFKISKFFQRMRLAFDEKGTVMAVVTVIKGDGALGVPEFYFNRPFMYLIWEKSTGAVLLAGTVMDPTAKGD